MHLVNHHQRGTHGSAQDFAMLQCAVIVVLLRANCPDLRSAYTARPAFSNNTQTLSLSGRVEHAINFAKPTPHVGPTRDLIFVSVTSPPLPPLLCSIPFARLLAPESRPPKQANGHGRAASSLRASYRLQFFPPFALPPSESLPVEAFRVR